MTPFIRDRFTWLAYGLLAYFAYMLAALGPLMPFLRDELGLTYTVAALHLSAFALGMVVAGLTAERLVRRWGQRAIFWLGGGGMALGGVALTLGQQAPVTIIAAFFMGLIGTYLPTIIQAALTDRHGTKRAIALTESNVAASIASVCAPLLVGLGESSGLGWRAALIAGAVVWTAAFLLYRHMPFPVARKAATSGAQRPLQRRFWAYWLVVLFSVAIEWCVVFWGADFLINSVGLEKVTAATLMSLFLLGMVIGRVIGSWLTHTMESSRLLLYAIGVVIVGFPLFWLGQTPLVNVVGLFICGLGIANLFPLTVSVATGIDPALSNMASARLSLASGTAILVAPQVLAALADQVGIFNAFAVAAGLMVAVALIVAATRRMGHAAQAPA